MEELRKNNLEKDHQQLMAAIRSGENSLPHTLLSRINDKIGSLSQELLVNAAETRGLKQTPLEAAYISNKPAICETLLKWRASPTPELFQYLIELKTPDSNKQVGELIEYATGVTIEFAFFLACLRANKPVIAQFIKLGLPAEMLNSHVSDSKTSLYKSQLRDVMIYVVSQGDVDLVRLLDSYIVMSESPLFETLYLTAAFYGHEPLVMYLLARMGASPEARMRAFEILGAHRMLTNRPDEANAFWEEEYKLRKVRAPIYEGDITLLLELSPGDIIEPHIKALTIMEKHFRHRHEFSEALLLRPYTEEVTIYTMDVIMHQKEISTENLNLIKRHLIELNFTENDEVILVMQCIEWVITAMGYVPDEHNYMLLPTPIVRDEADPLFHELAQRLKHIRRPPVTPAPFAELAEFACWLLMLLENCPDFDPKREWFRYMLRRLVQLSAPRSRTFSLLHRLLEMHLAEPGEQNIFEILIGAEADLTALDSEGNTLLHKAIEAHDKGAQDAAKLIETLLRAKVPLDAVNNNGVSVENDVARVVGDRV